MATIAKMLIALGLQPSEYTKGLKKAQAKTKNFSRASGRSFKSLDKQFGMMTKSMVRFGLAAAGVAGVGGLLRLGKASISAADELGKAAEKIGLTTDALQELRFAAELSSGMLANQTDMALQRFSRRVGEAANDTGELKGTLDRLGISVRDGNGNVRDLNDILDDFADAIRDADSDTERLAIAFKGFDSEGAKLVTTLNKGSGELRRLRKEARDLGAVLDAESIEKASKADRQFKILSHTIGTDLKEAFIELSPILISISDKSVAMANALKFLIDPLDFKQAKENLKFEELDTLEQDVDKIVKKLKDYQTLANDITFGGHITEEEFKTLSMINNTIDIGNSLLKKKRTRIKELKTELDLTSEAEIDLAKNTGKVIDKFAGLGNILDEVMSDRDAPTALQDSIDVMLDSIKTTTERIEEQSEVWRLAYRMNLISVEDLNKGLEKVKEQAEDSNDALIDAIQGFGREFSRTMADMLVDGKFTFQELGRSFLKDFIEKLIHTRITEPLLSGFNFGGLFKSRAVGNTGTGGGVSTTNLGAGGVPIGVTKAPGIVVNVNDARASGGNVEVQENQSPKGGKMIDILIKDTVNKGIASGNYDAVLGSTYGLRRKGGVR